MEKRKTAVVFLFLCIVLCVALLAAGDALAQCEIQSIAYLGSVDLGDHPLCVAVSGSYAYVVCRDSGFRVVDISDPMSPQIVSSIEMPAYYPEIVVRGSYAYVSNGNFNIIDISDPTAPFITGSLDFMEGGGGACEDVAVSGSYAYLACYSEDLKVVDISNPFLPQIVSSVETDSSSRNVEVCGSYAYVEISGGDIKILDISDPTAPSIAGTLERSVNGITGMAVSGSYAYFMNSGGRNQLDIADISDPTSAHFVSTVCMPDGYYWGYNVLVSGSYAYVIDNRINIVDISDPTSAHLVSSFYAGPFKSAVDIDIVGQFAYVAYRTSMPNGGLQIVDLSNPSQLPVVGSLDWTHYYGVGGDVAVSGSTVYAAAAMKDMRAIDISNPAAPALTGVLEIPESGHFTGIDVSGSTVYVADDSEGLHIVDVSDASSPILLNSVATPGASQSVAVSGSYAYVADGNSGLQVIDISDPASAHIVGSADLPGSADGIALSGSYACVVGYAPTGLQIVEISDPTSPAIVGSTTKINYPFSVAASGSYAYVVSFDRGMSVVDISDPAVPTTVGSLNLFNPICGLPYGFDLNISISDSYVFISQGSDKNELYVIDVIDPTSPRLVAVKDLPGYGASTVAISFPFAILDTGALHVIDLCPDSGGIPAIGLDTSTLSVYSETGRDLPDLYFDVWNSGTGTLSYFLSTDAWWLNLDPFRGGSLGESDTIAVSFNRSAFPAGEHTGRIFVADPIATNNPQHIDVTVTVPTVYYNLTTSPSPPEAGSVTGGGTYESGEWAQMDARPATGWEFDHWQSYDYSVNGSRLNPISIRVNADTSVTAVFRRIFHDLTIYSYPAGGGLAWGTGRYEYGSTIILNAEPSYGWRLSRWQGDDINGSTQNPEQITMDADKTVTAVFEVIPLTHIYLVEPANESVRETPPRFQWTSGAGTDTTFSVDISFSPYGPYYSTWEHLGITIESEDWVMSPKIWNRIPSRSYVFWRVRGIERGVPHPTIVYSNTVWFFYKP